jgi:hypothetical protein
MSGLSVDTFADYDAVKTAILEKCSVSKETYHIRLRSGRKKEKGILRRIRKEAWNPLQ